MIKIKPLRHMCIIFFCTLFYPKFVLSVRFIEGTEVISGNSTDYITATIFGSFLQQIDAVISMSKVNDKHLMQAVMMTRKAFLEQQVNHQLTSKNMLHLIERFNNWLAWYGGQIFDTTTGVFLQTLRQISMQALQATQHEMYNGGIRSKNYTKNKKLLFIAVAVSSLIGCCLFYQTVHFSNNNSFFNRLLGTLRLQMKVYDQRDEQTKLEHMLEMATNEIELMKEKNNHFVEALSQTEEQKLNNEKMQGDLLGLRKKLQDMLCKPNVSVREVEAFLQKEKEQVLELISIYQEISNQLEKAHPSTPLKKSASMGNVFVDPTLRGTAELLNQVDDMLSPESKASLQGIKRSASFMERYKKENPLKKLNELLHGLNGLLSVLEENMKKLTTEYNLLNSCSD